MANSDPNGSRLLPGIFPMFRNQHIDGQGQGFHRNVHSFHPPASIGISHTVEPLPTEGSRMIRDNLHTVMEELRPLVERARTADTHAGISLASWLRQPETASADPAPSVSIQMEQPAAPAPSVVNHPAPQPGVHHNNNNNNNNNQDDDALPQNSEARALLRLAQKYLPFLLILIGKAMYDHRAGILIFVGLFVTFSHANAVLKREIANQARRSLVSLLVIACNLTFCICFIYYIFQEQKLYLSLVFIPPYSQPLSMWDLLWMVGVTDFVLKLITIIVKVGLAVLPVFLLPYQKRGKIYLLVESSSQLYRSLAPIQPWLYYLLESYQGPEKVVGVFLSAAYMVSKGTDLLKRGRHWRQAAWKVLQQANLGVSPSKEQLATAGQQCPICVDDFVSPVLLPCRHVFCEACVATWFDREQTCPMCRARVSEDPSWRDGSTTYFSQLY